MRRIGPRFGISPSERLSPGGRADGLPAGELTAALVYELLDAHADTIDLAAELASEGRLPWCAHLAYLRDLQRVGREWLAHEAMHL